MSTKDSVYIASHIVFAWMYGYENEVHTYIYNAFECALYVCAVNWDFCDTDQILMTHWQL